MNFTGIFAQITRDYSEWVSAARVQGKRECARAQRIAVASTSVEPNISTIGFSETNREKKTNNSNYMHWYLIMHGTWTVLHFLIAAAQVFGSNVDTQSVCLSSLNDKNDGNADIIQIRWLRSFNSFSLQHAQPALSVTIETNWKQLNGNSNGNERKFGASDPMCANGHIRHWLSLFGIRAIILNAQNADLYDARMARQAERISPKWRRPKMVFYAA